MLYMLCYAMLCNDLFLGFLDRLLHFTLPRLYVIFLYEIGRFLFQSSSFIYTTTGQQGSRVCYVTRMCPYRYCPVFYIIQI